MTTDVLKKVAACRPNFCRKCKRLFTEVFRIVNAEALVIVSDPVRKVLLYFI